MPLPAVNRCRHRVSTPRFTGLLVALAMACLLLGAAAPTPAAALDADTMLSPETVLVINLGLPQTSIEELEAEPDEYVEGTLAVAETAGTPATIGDYSAPMTVGIRLKGGLGSFQTLAGKAAFKVKFNSFVSGQKFLGLKKLTLNNMIQDDSMIHEALTYEAFRAAGIHAPRTGYAYVYVNGVDYGLHLNLETVDDVALKRWFGSFKDPQHLYEGTPWKDLRTENLHEFEVDEGDEDDLGDLEALIAATEATSPTFSERMSGVADVAQMTRFWAAERYLDHWDGYSGGVVNNYYLLSDEQGVFQMLPWGTDQTLNNWRYPFAPDSPESSAGRLFEQCLEEPACEASYREELTSVADSITALHLVPKAEELAARLAPWQAKERAESQRASASGPQISVAVAGTVEFLSRRAGALAHWLETGEMPPGPDPGPGNEEPTDPGGESTPGEAGDGAQTSAKRATIASRVSVSRTQLPQGQVVTRLAVTGPGRITLIGEIGAPGARRRACVATVRVSEAGTAALRCRLSAEARRHLKSRPLALRIRARFLPADGGSERVVTHVARLPRQKPR